MSNLIISDLEKTNNENQLVDILPQDQQLVVGGKIKIEIKITITIKF